MRVWDFEIGQCKAVFEGHTATIRAVAVHGNVVISGSHGHDGRVWSLEKKTCLHVLEGHESKIYSVAFDEKRIVTGSLDKKVRVWDPASGYVFHPRPLFGIIFLNRTALVRPFYRATQVW
jgi:F-box and WD-40 domain protein CDC4